MIDVFTLRCRAIQLLDEFPHHVGAAKGMVGAVEHMVRSHDFAAAIKLFEMIADGVNVELAEIMIDGMRQRLLALPASDRPALGRDD